MDISTRYISLQNTNSISIITIQTCESRDSALELLGTVGARNVAPSLVQLDTSDLLGADEINLLHS